MIHTNGCAGCGQCCRTVRIDIPEPETYEDFEDLKWYIYHEGLSLFIDPEGDWTVEIATRCKNLDENNACRIYEKRPPICSGFNPSECMVHAKERWKNIRDFKTTEDIDQYVKELEEQGILMR
jgi:Fe-S-cluster containining protein